MLEKLSENFYAKDAITVAKQLLGKVIVHELDGNFIMSQITETESYCGIEDKGCHAYGNKRTQRTETMYQKGGTAYVYLIYGMYDCFNVVTGLKDDPQAVLIRGARPFGDADILSFNRFNKKYSDISNYQKRNFLNGPGKFCRAMKITRQQNDLDLCNSNLYICDCGFEPDCIYSGKRINIDYAEEYVDKLWRFYIK